MADRVLNYIIDAIWKGRGAAGSARRDLEGLGKAGEKSAQGLKKSEDAVSKLGKAFKGLVIAGVLAKLGGEAAEFAQASLQAASDAEEGYSKFQTVFKETAGVVEVQLANIATATGRSRFDLIDYAATLQDTFVPLGFAREEAAELSTTLVQLAIDLASFNNLSEADVVRDLQSALVGNTETLRKYGVVANQAAIEARALSDGLWDGTGAIDAQAKAAAILAITLDSTTDAQGDAARTIDSYANRQRQAEAATKDLQVATGQMLSAWGDAGISARMLITNALLPMVQSIAEVITGARELSAAVDEVITDADVENVRDYLHVINLLAEQIERSGPIGSFWRTLFTGDTSVIQARQDLLKIAGDAGQAAHDFETLQAMMRGLGFETDELGISFNGLAVSWIEVQKAIDNARLADRLREIDEEMGPVDAKLRNMGPAGERAAFGLSAAAKGSEAFGWSLAIANAAMEEGSPAMQAYEAAVVRVQSAIINAGSVTSTWAADLRDANAAMFEGINVEGLTDAEQAMLAAAAAGGAYADQLFILAGAGDDAAEAIKNMATIAKAEQLGEAVASGFISAKEAVEELQNFIDNFDLETTLLESRDQGQFTSLTEDILKRFEPALVEYATGIAESAATAVNEALTPAGDAIEEVTTDIEDLVELEKPIEFDTNEEAVITSIGNLEQALIDLTGQTWFVQVSAKPVGGAPSGGGGVPAVPPTDLPDDTGGNIPQGVLPVGVGVNNQQPLVVNVFGAPGMSPAAVANEAVYQISQYGYELR